MYGFKILCEISKVPFEISHRNLNTYTAKYAFYEALKNRRLMISSNYDILSLSETGPRALSNASAGIHFLFEWSVALGLSQCRPQNIANPWQFRVLLWYALLNLHLLPLGMSLWNMLSITIDISHGLQHVDCMCWPVKCISQITRSLFIFNKNIWINNRHVVTCGIRSTGQHMQSAWRGKYRSSSRFLIIVRKSFVDLFLKL